MDQKFPPIKELTQLRFNWEAFMAFVMEDSSRIKKIGYAWPLFFDINFNADNFGMYSATYAKLGKRYGVAMITVKKWREHLCKESVIESFSRGHSVAFRLRHPYLDFLKQDSKRQEKEKTNQVILLEKMIKALKDDSLLNTA